MRRQQKAADAVRRPDAVPVYLGRKIMRLTMGLQLANFSATFRQLIGKCFATAMTD